MRSAMSTSCVQKVLEGSQTESRACILHKNIAYFEVGSEGHCSIWIRGIVEAFRKLEPGWQLDVWVPQDFLEMHGDWCGPYIPNTQGHSGSNVTFRPHEEVLSDRERQSHGLALDRYELLRRCIEADGAAVCFVALNLDSLLKSIALSRPGSLKTKVVGVLSKPFLHCRQFSSKRTRHWVTLRRWLPSYAKTLLACHDPEVAEVLTLDHLAPGYYNRVMRTAKFRFLPDYRFDITPFADPKEHFGFPEVRTLFLLPGTIDRRKGVIELLAAVRERGSSRLWTLCPTTPVMPWVFASQIQ